MNSISVSNLTKVYGLFSSKMDRIKEAFSISGKKYHQDFYALKGISFNIAKGECVGIIGVNGSGKSTLLKILTGVLTQTGGDISIDGKISALLELGAGFNPEYTGLENIYLNSMLMGYSKKETKERLDDIIRFADIGEYINQPVKNYSSGMFVRLAFSIAINVEPDILIIDEALSVGDIFFQQKCYNKIKELSGRSTVLIVSHDLNSLTKFCKRLILLNQGEIVFDGDAKEAIKRFYKIKQGSLSEKNISLEKNSGLTKNYKTADIDTYSGNMNAVIKKYFYSVNDIPYLESIEEGDRVKISFVLEIKKTIDNPIVGYQVRDKYGMEIFGETSCASDAQVTKLGLGYYVFRFTFVWPEVREGDYFITVGVGNGLDVLNQVEECWLNNVIHLNNSTNGKVIFGVFNREMEQFEYIKQK